MKAESTFDPSDLFYQLLDLAELMQATYDILHDMDYVRQDGSRIVELDRVASMHRIACRDVGRLRDMAAAFDGPKQWAVVESDGSHELRKRIDAFKAAREAYRKCEEDGEASTIRGAYEAAEESVLSCPCRTMADVRLKADLILSDDDLNDTVRNCSTMKNGQHVRSLTPFLLSLKGETL